MNHDNYIMTFYLHDFKQGEISYWLPCWWLGCNPMNKINAKEPQVCDNGDKWNHRLFVVGWM